MPVAFASWVHGQAGRVERPDALVASTPFVFGWGLSLAGLPNADNWLHFAIPTPVIVANKRYNITQIGIKATRQSPQARIAAVHAYDGHHKFYANETTVPNLPIVAQPSAASYPDLGNFIAFPVGGLIRTRALSERSASASACSSGRAINPFSWTSPRWAAISSSRNDCRGRGWRDWCKQRARPRPGRPLRARA